MRDKKLILKNAYFIITVFIILSVGLSVYSFIRYPETTLTMDQLLQEATFLNYTIEGNTMVSQNEDPIIEIPLNEHKNLKCVSIDIENISGKSFWSQIYYYNSTSWKDIDYWIEEGLNHVYIPAFRNMANVDYLRLDLCATSNVEIKLNYVIINSHKFLLILNMIVSLICAVLLDLVFSGALSFVINKIYLYMGQLIQSENWRKTWRLIIKCAVVYIVGIISIVRADFLYVDDLGRTFTGILYDWDVYNRYFAEIVCKVLSADTIARDTSPLPQMLTMLLMAIAVVIIIKEIADDDNWHSNYMVMAAVPFALSPYFLENVSFKIESIIHGVSVLFCILPVLLIHKKKVLYVLTTVFCIIMMCITYQGASGVFPIVVVMIVAVEWNKGESIKKIWQLVYTSVLGYAGGLLIFKRFIMRPIETHVSSEILPINKLLSGYISNIIEFYNTVLKDFEVLWLVLIAIIVVAFVITYTITSKRNCVMAFFVSLFSVLLMGCLCFGIYPILENCVFYPRIMYGLCIVVSMLCIFIVSKGRVISKAACILLSWCFFIFAFTYGNCLDLQQEYTQVKRQAVLDYLNENYNENIQYTLQINGSIGIAPAIADKLETNEILRKLIPETLAG